jgi:DNA mismatch repair protein MutL
VAKIALLPPEISQKIAAGEVIERPSSVVKELVENSLDAGAVSVRVELLAGGKRLIRVQDDGCGMSREDALLAFERHSTSKIRNEEDLDRILTLGFRGEALASIAAVSRLTLKTSDGGSKAVEVTREGDKVLEVKDIALSRGTTIEVRDLFFNLPARLKFLRSDQSELNQTSRFLTLVACAYPGVAFALGQGQRRLFDWPMVTSTRERLYQVHGKAFLDRLMEVDYAEGPSRVHGFASRPPSGRVDKSRQFFYVNLRPVKDRTLQAALNQAFRLLLEKNLYAEAFLYLDHPHDEVDVNVHPAKAEVRFRDPQSVFRLVQRGIEQAALNAGTVKPVTFSRPEETAGARQGIEEGPAAGLFGDPYGPRAQPSWPAGAAEPRITGAGGLRVLGQFLDMYIVAVSEEGLFIIDQHNAHEKVLYERFKEVRAGRAWPRKAALIPLLMDLSPSEILSFEENGALFEENGFRVEEAGGRTYALKEFPDFLEDADAGQIFLSLLAEVKDEKLDGRPDRMLATLACKAAVKAGEPLPRVKMEYLVEELFKLTQHSLCPHGRPILLKIDRSQVDKGLRRPSN